MGITFNEDFTIGLSLVEYPASHYTWATKAEVSSTPQLILLVHLLYNFAGVTLSDTLVEYNDGTVIVALDIAITANFDSFVDFYQVEYKRSSDSDFIIYAQGSGLNHRVLNVIDRNRCASKGS